MVPVNNLLNCINNTCTNPDAGTFKKITCTRAANILVVPTEIFAVAQNVLLTPVYTATTILKGMTKIVALVTGSQALKNFEAKLPGFYNLLKAIARIIAYTIGTALTATLGFISPQANFKLHCGLGLAVNHREHILKGLAEQEAQMEILEEKFKQDQANKKSQEIQKAQEQEALDNLATAFTIADEVETIQFLPNKEVKTATLMINDPVESEQPIESSENKRLKNPENEEETVLLCSGGYYNEEEIVKKAIEQSIKTKEETVEDEAKKPIEETICLLEKKPMVLEIKNEVPAHNVDDTTQASNDAKELELQPFKTIDTHLNEEIDEINEEIDQEMEIPFEIPTESETSMGENIYDFLSPVIKKGVNFTHSQYVRGKNTISNYAVNPIFNYLFRK